MKVTNLSSNYDAAVQSQQVDDAIAQKFDMIVIVYVNDQAIIPALTRAKAANIPVVLVVTPAEEGIRRAVHVVCRHRSCASWGALPPKAWSRG